VPERKRGRQNLTGEHDSTRAALRKMTVNPSIISIYPFIRLDFSSSTTYKCSEEGGIHWAEFGHFVVANMDVWCVLIDWRIKSGFLGEIEWVIGNRTERWCSLVGSKQLLCSNGFPVLNLRPLS
jgi:hypothetical protein